MVLSKAATWSGWMSTKKKLGARAGRALSTSGGDGTVEQGDGGEQGQAQSQRGDDARRWRRPAG